ncbi:hypothetical protein [Sorangium sp. So ce542]|uniref:hypothetical protein n=1 Tax=Sorangium sp. So ce542 TaxID=3133316 RepID=UPI003F5D61CA
MLTCAMVTCAALGVQPGARAEPDLAAPRTVWSEDYSRSWIVYEDRDDPSLVYRLPHYYEIQRNTDGAPEVVPQRGVAGELILRIVWGTANWTGDASELLARLRALKGALVRIAALVPVNIDFEAAPELLEEFHATVAQDSGALAPLPGLSFTTTIVVPPSEERRFRSALARGGITSRLLMSFELTDPLRGVVRLRYETSMFLGALRLCDVTPELHPCGRVQ